MPQGMRGTGKRACGSRDPRLQLLSAGSLRWSRCKAALAGKLRAADPRSRARKVAGPSGILLPHCVSGLGHWAGGGHGGGSDA